jgi:hypothetical protein
MAAISIEHSWSSQRPSLHLRLHALTLLSAPPCPPFLPHVKRLRRVLAERWMALVPHLVLHRVPRALCTLPGGDPGLGDGIHDSREAGGAVCGEEMHFIDETVRESSENHEL